MFEIRRAEDRDIPAVMNLLRQVLEIHAVIRPDIFKSGTTKHSADELREIFRNDNTPVFVATEGDKVLGYSFCELRRRAETANTRESTTLYIDDLCVDEACRHMHVGKRLFDYLIFFAREHDCYDVSLNLWAGNDSAQRFYERMGFTPRNFTMERLL